MSEPDNIIMGPVVSDAAGRHERGIGLATTQRPMPRSSQTLIEQATSDLTHLLVNYRVPMKDGSKLKLRAVNWPKGIYVEGLTPAGLFGAGKVRLQTLLSRHAVPPGTERNTSTLSDFSNSFIGLRIWRSGTG